MLQVTDIEKSEKVNHKKGYGSNITCEDQWDGEGKVKGGNGGGGRRLQYRYIAHAKLK